MASKSGFSYYNVDTDRYQDIKIKRLKKDFGCSGIAIYDYILCEIYRVRGCFIMWDESSAFDVAEYFGIKESLVNEVVNYCGVVGLFNKELLTRGSIITSLSIQKRYSEMCSRAKRINCPIPHDIDLSKLELIPEEIAKLQEQTLKLPEENAKLPEEIDRVEKSRVKESKEIPPTPKIELKPFVSDKPNFNLQFATDEWKALIVKWVKYKESIKKPITVQASIEAFYSTLRRESGSDIVIAGDILDHTIAAGWASIVVPDSVKELIKKKDEKSKKQTVVF